jgi:hypothetical protein
MFVKNIGEKIMKKTNFEGSFVQISANFKCEIENVKIGKGGGGALSR